MSKSISQHGTNYLQNFNEAALFNKEMGLPVPVFTPNPELILDMPFLCSCIVEYFYNFSQLQLEDVAQKCFILSKVLQDFLKRLFNIDSIITSGCLFENGKQLFGEEKQEIHARLVSNKISPPVKFHTWLTLGNFEVLDITYLPSVWADYKIHNQKVNDEDFMKILWHQPAIAQPEVLYFKPTFLGYDYFEKVKIEFQEKYFIKEL